MSMAATTSSILDGVIRDGRHHLQVRVYYEDTDFAGWPKSQQREPRR
jgi:hypothetical protein